MSALLSCPICKDQAASVRGGLQGDDCRIDCPRCGNFDLSGSADSVARHHMEKMSPLKLDALSHSIRAITLRSGPKRPFFNTDTLDNLRRDARIRNPLEQLDNLTLWAGSNADDPFSGQAGSIAQIASIVGGRNDNQSINALTEAASEKRLVESLQPLVMSTRSIRLTMDGWVRFASLQRVRLDSRLAFMAMAFSVPQTQNVYVSCFQPAVQAAGFELRKLNEGQPAGLIDMQLRVAIRTARFLIADLSDGNKGAYWEAGFAEGLDKPVIYVCEKTIWNHPDAFMRPHFDTSHLATVIYDLDDLSRAKQELTNLIRNTFPADAFMVDHSA